MIVRQIFAEHKPNPGEVYDLYTVPSGSSAMGTLYVANQQLGDRVTVQLLSPALGSSDPSTYVLYQVPLFSQVPIYLQQIHLDQGDGIRISTESGACSFVFTGEEYVS